MFMFWVNKRGRIVTWAKWILHHVLHFDQIGSPRRTAAPAPPPVQVDGGAGAPVPVASVGETREERSTRRRAKRQRIAQELARGEVDVSTDEITSDDNAAILASLPAPTRVPRGTKAERSAHLRAERQRHADEAARGKMDVSTDEFSSDDNAASLPRVSAPTRVPRGTKAERSAHLRAERQRHADEAARGKMDVSTDEFSSDDNAASLPRVSAPAAATVSGMVSDETRDERKARRQALRQRIAAEIAAGVCLADGTTDEPSTDEDTPFCGRQNTVVLPNHSVRNPKRRRSLSADAT